MLTRVQGKHILRTFLLLALLSFAPLSAASPETEAFSTQIVWTLSLDADGKINDLKPADPSFLPEVRRQIEPVVRKWHFEPGKVNGRPAQTQTTLRVHVEFTEERARARNGRITFADTGPMYLHVKAPTYPTHAKRAGHEGGVMILIEFDADGRVISAKNAPEMQVGDVDPELVDAALDAAKRWTFRPERVAEHGIPSRALAPICFKIVPGSSCKWHDTPGSKPIRSGQPIALTSVVGIDMGHANAAP
jgi:TonB family protein